jgi:deoxyribose-phosphate aldolase
MTLEYATIAKLLDHALLSPAMPREELERGLAFARQYAVASVCIVPYAVALARDALAGSDVLVGTVIGFPHGTQATAVKFFEAEQALLDGAQELDAVVNVNRVLSGEFDSVRSEMAALTETAHAAGAKIKVIFENCYLEDRHKVRLCQIAAECGVDWVKTSTGVGPGGATLADVQLMRQHVPPSVGVKASGGVRTLANVLSFRPYVTRCGTSSSRAILDELRASARP